MSEDVRALDRTYICRDCGYTVHTFAYVGSGGIDVCRTCQFIAEHPQIPADARALLRGEGGGR